MKYMCKNLRVILLTIVIFCGCSSNNKQSDYVKIGVIIPQTGALAFMGELEQKGIELAVSEHPEMRLKILLGDSKGSAKEAITIAQKFLNVEKTPFIFTSGTAVSRSVAALHQQNNFLQTAFCMDPTIQDKSNGILRLYYGMEKEAEMIVKYFAYLAKTKKNFTNSNIGILAVNHQGTMQQTNNFLLPGLKAIGIVPKFVETYELNQKDFINTVAKIKKSGIEYLVLIDYGFQLPGIFKVLEEVKVLKKLNIIGGWGFIAKKFISDDKLENIVVATPTCMVQKNSKYLEFQKKYYERFKSEANFESALAYQNIIFLGSLIKAQHSNTNPAALTEKLLNTKHNSILGDIQITQEGRLEIPMTLAKYVNGKLVEIEGIN